MISPELLTMTYCPVIWAYEIENHTKTTANQSWTVNQFDLKLKSGQNAHPDDMEDLDLFQKSV